VTHEDAPVRPEDAVHQQLDLLLRMGQPSFEQVVVGTLGPAWSKALGERTLEMMPDVMRRHIRVASTYHVSADMVTLVERAAIRLNDDDTYDVSSPPTPAGFAVLDRPLSVGDVWGNEMLVHAVAWGPMKVISVRDPEDSRRYRETGVIERDVLDHDGNEVSDATLFVMYNDVNRRPDFYAAKILEEIGERRYRESFGHLSLIGAELLKDGSQVGPRTVDPKRLPLSQLQQDQRWDTEKPRPFTNSFRLMLAMFELMTQRVTTTARRPAAKTTRKRAAREGMASGEVTVVTLRRHSVPDPDRERESREVDWSCRWVVDGHWHRYRVGPGRAGVRRMWVDDYVKGPDDKPLKVTHKIYDLRR